jgi:hypothetical protein
LDNAAARPVKNLVNITAWFEPCEHCGACRCSSYCNCPHLVVAGTVSRSFEGISGDVCRFMPVHFRIADTKISHGTSTHMGINRFKRMNIHYTRLIVTSAG